MSDLNETLLFTEVSDLLGIPYLSPFNDGDYDLASINGVTYGLFSRPMVSLPVRIGNRETRNVHFLVDTGAPRTEIPISTFETLCGRSDGYVPLTFFAVVVNRKFQLGLCSSTGNHADVPVLGQDFLKEMKATLIVDYYDQTVKIIFK